MQTHPPVRYRLSGLALAVVCAVSILAGCTGGPTPQATIPSPEATFAPTKTVNPTTPTAGPTAKPTHLPTFTPGPTPEPDVIVVDAALQLGRISPLVYGTNFGPWQNSGKSDLEKMEAAGFTFYRYPGGNYGDEYSPSESSLDEFVAMCRKLGAEPMVNVRLFKSTPEAAAKIVRYANITKGYQIKYWGIGNEPSLYLSNRKLSGYDTEAFNAQWREFALAMKAVDPDIQLIGPETHQYSGLPGEAIVDIHSKDWMESFLLANGDLLDIVSFHRYPFGQFDPFPKELLRNSEEWDKIIPNLRALIHATTGKDLPIAVTEVNSNWSNRARKETTPDTLLNAVWWADVLGRMIEQRVDIVAQFAVDGDGGWSLLGSQQPRPAYYVYSLYHQFGDDLVFSSSGIENVSAYAALKQDGSLTILLVNRSTGSRSVKMDVRNFQPGTGVRWMVLDADHQAEEIPPPQITAQSEFELPALSVNLILISPASMN